MFKLGILLTSLKFDIIIDTLSICFRLEEENHKLLSRLEHTKLEFEQQVSRNSFLARLHEVHRAIVVTSVVRVYVYVFVRVTLSVKVFSSPARSA